MTIGPTSLVLRNRSENPYMASRSPSSVSRSDDARPYDRFGPVSEMAFVGDRWTVLLGPDACGEALRNGDKAFASGPAWSRLVGPFFDRGLMLLDFDEHHGTGGSCRRRSPATGSRPTPRPLRPAVAAGLDGWEPGRDSGRTRPQAADPGPRHAALHGRRRPGRARRVERVNRAFIACVQAAAGVVRRRSGHALGPGMRGRRCWRASSGPPAGQAARAAATTSSRCSAPLRRRRRRRGSATPTSSTT